MRSSRRWWDQWVVALRPSSSPGRGQDHGPGADRSDKLRSLGGPAQVVADRRVAHGLDGRGATTGHEHHGRVGHVAEGLVGDDGEGCVGGHGLDPLGHYHRPVLVVEAL
jgi:hypothetical protein